MLNPRGEKNLVYFGLGMKITPDNIDQFEFWNDPNTIFIVSSNTSIARENVYRIPTEYVDSHHFIAAADLAITKAGWGSVSEAIIGNTPLLIINRQSMKEDRNTISYLKERGLCKTIEWTGLQQFNSLNEVIKLYEDNEEPPENKLYDIVRNLIELLRK
jgi:UDP-N-acetylglucosamine:LPS N-acetylglucosamine transferase